MHKIIISTQGNEAKLQQALYQYSNEYSVFSVLDMQDYSRGTLAKEKRDKLVSKTLNSTFILYLSDDEIKGTLTGADSTFGKTFYYLRDAKIST